MSVNLLSPEGRVVSVPDDQIAGHLSQGFRYERTQERADRLQGDVTEQEYGGLEGAAAAFTTRALGAASLGLSDAVIGQLGGGEELSRLREINPRAALAGTITGAVAPGFAGGALRALPAARASRLGQTVTALGDGASLASRTGYAALGAATEGALQNAGAYITDVALGDRELSAEGFAGSMGKGALWGGVAGGALSLGAGGLTAARRLFPRTEMTAVNVAKAEREALDEVLSSLDDTETLKRVAREDLSTLRATRAAEDPVLAAKFDEIRAAKQREVFAKAETATARAERAEVQAAKARESVEKAKAPKRRLGREPTREELPGDLPTEAEIPGPTPTAAAIAGDVTEDATSLLERQLMGTKAALDEGRTLAQVGAMRPRAMTLDDALNVELAKVDPQAERLMRALDEAEQSGGAVNQWLSKYGAKGQVGKFERGQAARDVAEGWRSKGPGWVTEVPEGEGNVILRRGRQMGWRGTEAEREAAESAITSRVTPAEQEAAEAAVEARAGGGLLGGRRAKALAAASVEDVGPTIDTLLEDAIGSRVDNIAEDINESAQAIGRHEASNAELVEILGERAPISAQTRSQGFRASQRGAEASTAQAAADSAADLERAMDTISLPGAQRRGKGLLGLADDAGTALEALRMMGVPLPDPSSIPVVGPVLSLYLKARVIGKTFGRFGGKIAETAESTIASKAAATRERVLRAVDSMVEKGAKGLAKAAPRAGGLAAVIGHKLFDDTPAGEKRAPYTSDVKGGDLAAMFEARTDELVRAQQPGAVRRAVRDRVRASDPAIVDAIVAAQERKLAFLWDKMPKSDGPQLFGAPWQPSKASMMQWARYVEAAEDPAGVIEAAARGNSISMEGVETLKAVYPQLYQQAQRRLIEKAVEGGNEVPFPRRVQLSLLFDLPMDRSMDADYARFLQAPYQAQALAQQPAPAQPPTPTISADVNLGAAANPYGRMPP
jgi:hypothetical protein